MMRRRGALALLAGALLVLGAATSAYGQATSGPPITAAPDPTTTTSSTSTTTSTVPGTSTTTTTTVEATTTTDAPPPATVSAKTSNPVPQPGETVPISTPSEAGGQAVLDATKPAAAVLLPGDGGADIPMPAPKITRNANGSITVEVTIPPSTPPGVYVIAIVGTDSRGVSRAIVVPVVVRTRPRGASLSATKVPASTGPPVVVPEDVRAIVASIAKVDGGAAAVQQAVLHQGATLDISHSELIVHRPGDGGGSDSRPLVAAFAVALLGGGLVLLRRRTPATLRRNR